MTLLLARSESRSVRRSFMQGIASDLVPMVQYDAANKDDQDNTNKKE